MCDNIYIYTAGGFRFVMVVSSSSRRNAQIFPQALGSSQKLLMNFKALKDTLGQAADSADEPREDLLYQSMWKSVGIYS